MFVKCYIVIVACATIKTIFRGDYMNKNEVLQLLQSLSSLNFTIKLDFTLKDLVLMRDALVIYSKLVANSETAKKEELLNTDSIYNKVNTKLTKEIKKILK